MPKAKPPNIKLSVAGIGPDRDFQYSVIEGAGFSIAFRYLPAIKIKKHIPIPPAGKVTIAVQFIIPGLSLVDKQINEFKQLANLLGHDLTLSDFQNLQTKKTKFNGVLVTLCYLAESREQNAKRDKNEHSTSTLLIERFLAY